MQDQNDRVVFRNIHNLRIGTDDLDGAERFATDILGLQCIHRSNTRVYLRSDNRHHSLCYFKGEPGHHIAAFELKDHRGLETALALLKSRGIECGKGSAEESEDRFVHSFGWFIDLTGNRIEILVRPYEANRRYFPGRDAGIKGFGHIGLNSTDLPRDESFWLDHFNAKVSDWIGPVPLLRVSQVHHQVALFPTDKPGIQHINHQVESIDDLMRSFYFLRKKGFKIVFEPGRHPTSGGYFLYFEGHDGLIYEYSTSDRSIIEDEENYRPRQFPMEAESFCMFGSTPEIEAFK